ncbi:hypothetical protein ACIQ7N_05900 [Lysinibacillus sp. NPDC095746]|uniref:hypothetical protein n=1 Tax=Lysinibacillus sp. NPDC095746 TaxID=3364134 RepID=UPI003811EACE
MGISDTEEILQNRGTKDKRITYSDHAFGPTSRSFRTNKTPCCHFAFSQKKHLLLSLRFRAEKNICCCRFAFRTKTSVVPLRFRTEKTSVAVASLSHNAQKHLLLSLRFRT